MPMWFSDLPSHFEVAKGDNALQKAQRKVSCVDV